MSDPIKFVYTKNKRIGSKIIRFFTRMNGQSTSEIPSHFSIMVYDWLIIESTLSSGVKVGFASEFLPKHEVVACFRPMNNQREYFLKAKKMTGKIYSGKYDFMGAIYLGLMQMLNTLFGMKMPKNNKFESGNRYFCNELYSFISNKNVSMEHPNSLMLEMKRNERFTEVDL